MPALKIPLSDREKEYLSKERIAVHKSEYLNGDIVAMAGATSNHTQIAFETARHLGNKLDGQPCQIHLSDMKVRVTDWGLYTYPDIVINCGQPIYLDEKKDVLLNPKVIVEVLSPSTGDHDRGAKKERYFLIPSLQEYLLIWQDKKVIFHYIRADDTSWRMRLVQTEDDSIEFVSLGVTLTMRQIYLKAEIFNVKEPLQ